MYRDKDGEIDIDTTADMMELVESTTMNEQVPNKRNNKSNYHNKLKMNYEYVMWISIIIGCLWSTIDRFTVNLWPLWVNNPGPLIGNWSINVFVIISWISGRLMLVSSAVIFWLQCRVFWNYIVEKCPKWLYIGDIIQTNNDIHYYVGWWLIGLPVCIHVWSVLFSALFENDLYIYSTWWRPVDKTTGLEIPFYDKESKLLNLGINDVYRLCSTTLTFLFFIPLSMLSICKLRAKNYNMAMLCHYIGFSIYTIDLLRMYSHPHCWFVNAPFTLFWMIDRVYGIFWYRRNNAIIVKRIYFDEEYMIVYLRLPYKYDKQIGDIYWLNTHEYNFERSHPFTVINNHSLEKRKHKIPFKIQFENSSWKGHKFRLTKMENKNNNNNNNNNNNSNNVKVNEDSDHSSLLQNQEATLTSVYEMERLDTIIKQDSNNNSVQSSNDSGSIDSLPNNDDRDKTVGEPHNWDIAAIIQVFDNGNNNNGKSCSRTPWTQKLANYDEDLLVSLSAWGPYRSEYRFLKEKIENNNNNNSSENLPPIVLIGTGTGGSYIIDFIYYLQSRIDNNKEFELINPCYIYFSTNSIKLFQFFTDQTAKIPIKNVTINAHITRHDKKIIYNNEKYLNKKERNAVIGRMSIEQVLNQAAASHGNNLNVYYCGSPQVQTKVGKLCKQLNVTFFHGHTFH